MSIQCKPWMASPRGILAKWNKSSDESFDNRNGTINAAKPLKFELRDTANEENAWQFTVYQKFLRKPFGMFKKATLCSKQKAPKSSKQKWYPENCCVEKDATRDTKECVSPRCKKRFQCFVKLF